MCSFFDSFFGLARFFAIVVFKPSKNPPSKTIVPYKSNLIVRLKKNWCFLIVFKVVKKFKKIIREC